MLKMMILTILLSAGPSLAGQSAGSSDSPRYICDEQDVSELPGGRIPPACIRGKTNDRFQWSSFADIPIYVWSRYHKKVDDWIIKHQQQILKYAPRVIQYALRWRQEYEAIIAAPIVMRLLKK